MSLLGWVDELDQFLTAVPEPKRGGTWLYCPWTERHRNQGRVIWCLFRTKHWQTYRRHWRREHR